MSTTVSAGEPAIATAASRSKGLENTESPAHNSRFDLHTGEPIGIPAVTAIPVYACKIEDDAIWVDFDQQLNDAPIPHKPYH